MLLIFKRKFQGIANGKSHLSKIKSNSVDVNAVPPLLACEALNLLGSRVTGQRPLPSFTTCCIHSSPPELALILTRGFHWQMLHRSGLSNMLWSPLKLRLNFPLWLLIAYMQGFWYWHKVPSHCYSDPLNDNFFFYLQNQLHVNNPYLLPRSFGNLKWSPWQLYVVILRNYSVPTITVKEKISPQWCWSVNITAASSATAS